VSPWPKLLAALAALPVLALAAPAIPSVDPPARVSFDTKQVARGAALSAIGNCADCHTADGGKPFAGGRTLETPFGTLHGTNITPDPDTGIGRWSLDAFARALREGVDRRGEHLYPVFPYDHFTRLSDDDVAALYAFVMTRDPVRQRNRANQVNFPYNVREFIGLWKNLYFRPGRYVSDPQQSAQWNRGAYLAEGLGHCSACHSPRNPLGAEVPDRHFAGGSAGSWHAPALDRSSPSPVTWTLDELVAYLSTGVVERHAIAAGPMAPVVSNLGLVNDNDVRAMAVYVAWWMRGAEGSTPRAATVTTANAQGAAIYSSTCGECHDKGRTMSSGGALELTRAIALSLPTPANLIHITLEGIPPREGEASRIMPGFAGSLTEAQVVSLLTYLREDVAQKPPWPDLGSQVRSIANDGVGD
jgi:mono/diheme cytochrome c family protein